MLEKTKFILGEEGHILKKQNLFFWRYKKNSKREGHFWNNSYTSTTLVGEIVKAFK